VSHRSTANASILTDLDRSTGCAFNFFRPPRLCEGRSRNTHPRPMSGRFAHRPNSKSTLAQNRHDSTCRRYPPPHVRFPTKTTPPPLRGERVAERVPGRKRPGWVPDTSAGNRPPEHPTPHGVGGPGPANRSTAKGLPSPRPGLREDTRLRLGPTWTARETSHRNPTE
jgi:hypothetical protein